MMDKLLRAFETRDIETFLACIFPPSWEPIAARILESGATLADYETPFAPRWSAISPTVRYGQSELETVVKSCLYRAHDCLHNLWGLPRPTEFSSDEFYLYKRAQMCGEVAVLTLTEFVLAKKLLGTYPELKDMLWERNALPLLEGPLRGLSTQQIAGRMDLLLHRHTRSKWVRDSPIATAFADDYIPMLEADRHVVDANWALMRRANWLPNQIPDARYSRILDGLELTLWMIDDFYHLLHTDHIVDRGLMRFNRRRRQTVQLPDGWNQLPKN